ncbi:uncharacterized protein LOC143052247 [Mytilus galloprovincialis]|uniref:uncharacterized protein LOC143052247 n=1 Tax=Mytilus galloprovincialis TaxID=29158 RepID=UPI003F7C278C
MYNSVIVLIMIGSCIYLNSADTIVDYSCYKLDSSWKDINLVYLQYNNISCENQCKQASTIYIYYGTSKTTCYCQEAGLSALTEKVKDKCESQCAFNNQESCGREHGWILGGMIGAHQQTTHENGKWSLWNTWTFCEVNCVREDTTNGTQRRWRTCNGLKCHGDDLEEEPCYNPGICKGMRPKKLLCKCPKRLLKTKWHFLDGKNITNLEVKKIVLEDFNKNIKSEISVDKKTVSKEVRKKNSSANKRKSSQNIGWGCIVFLILPVVFLIFIDILNCCIHFRSRLGGRKRNRTRQTNNIQVERDSTKPLQENVNITESYYDSRCGNNFHPDEMRLETYQRRRDDSYQQHRDEWLQYI